MEGTDSPGLPLNGSEAGRPHDPATNGYPDATTELTPAPAMLPDKYLGELPRLRQQEDEDLQDSFRTNTKDLRSDYVKLLAERTELANKLAAAREACDIAERRLFEQETEQRRREEELGLERQQEDELYQNRIWSNSIPTRNRDVNGLHLPMPTANGNFRMPTSIPNRILPSIEGRSMTDPGRRALPAPGPPTGAVVVHHTGEVIGPVQRLGVDNAHIAEILKLPVRHQVYIRQGRVFNIEQLEAVHDPSDGKASKWLGLMIQATGEQQQQECTTCSKKNGIFSQCTIVPGTMFTRCGNCEWGHLGCSGAFPGNAVAPPARGSSGFTAVNTAMGNSDDFAASTSVFPSRAKPRRSLPNERGGKRTQQASTPTAEVSDPAGTFAAATSPDAQNEAADPSTPKSVSGQEPEITRATLELAHDDTVFTDPEVMEGVPVAKIDPSHPYWDPEWRMIEDIIAPKLKDWEVKLEEELASNNDKSAKFLANRQVNRGRAVLEYLRDGEVHPYQLVRKELIHQGYTNYDTIYRLIGTLQELKKFNLDISPLQWMRQRVQEVYQKDPEKFRLEIMVKHMYHDAKLMDLRVKNGFGNIGRPSGLKAKSKRLPARKTPKQPGTGEKRKTNPGPARGTPKKQRTLAAQAAQDGGDDDEGGVQQSPGLPLTADHLRSLDAGTDMQVDDDAASDYTAADSFCGAETKKWDWRLAQVKTMDNMSSDTITQYWNFKPDADFAGGGKLEHQVLREVDPVSWGVYKDPVDFHVHTSQIVTIEYCKESLMIAVRVVENGDNHGDILARFKRPRTMDRWLKFVEERSMQLTPVAAELLQENWDKMAPQPLPETDSE